VIKSDLEQWPIQLHLVPPKAPFFEGKELVDEAGVKQLSSLPGLPELRAQLLSLIQTPAGSLVRLLNTPGGQIARAIDAKAQQGEN